MSRFSSYVDQQSYRRHPIEVEGFSKAIGFGADEYPACGSHFGSTRMSAIDFRGATVSTDGNLLPAWAPAIGNRKAIEWETAPAPSGAAANTVFTWIASSVTRPFRPAYPYATARLSVDGVYRLTFPLGYPSIWSVVPAGAEGVGFVLAFEPKRFIANVEGSHRAWEPFGVSGFYRLEVPAALVKAGKPLRLKVEIDTPPADVASLFILSPRNDALSLSLATLRDEVGQLQADMVQLKRSHEMLYAQVYPELAAGRGHRKGLIKSEKMIVWQHELNHYHPATITVLRSGEAVITAREAEDHLDPNGRMIICRSRDGGRTWSPAEKLFDVGRVDHRSSPIFEATNGDWLASDYRAGSLYTPDGKYDQTLSGQPTLWGAWSTDQGKTWQFTKEPITVPGMNPYAEAERHMIQLPASGGGRLLMAANYAPYKDDGKTAAWTHFGVAIHYSDDNGRTWHFLTKVGEDIAMTGEPTLLRTKSGRIVLLGRTEVVLDRNFTNRGMLLQSVSNDDGKTWSKLERTKMSSMSAPAHLLQLQDGRILVSHASRFYPGSIYLTTSSDEGRTWDTDHTRILTTDLSNDDSAYPTSDQLPDGTVLTTWYNNLFGKFFMAVARWRPEDL